MSLTMKQVKGVVDFDKAIQKSLSCCFECLYHITIPTLFTSVAYQSIEDFAEKNNLEVNDIIKPYYKYASTCRLCWNSLVNDKVSGISFEFMLGNCKKGLAFNLKIGNICAACSPVPDDIFHGVPPAHSTYILCNTLNNVMHWERYMNEKLDVNLCAAKEWQAITLQCVEHAMVISNPIELLSKVGKLEKVCQACGEPQARYRCAACKCTRYCSMECHVADWKLHKKACKFIRNQDSLFDMEDVINIPV